MRGVYSPRPIQDDGEGKMEFSFGLRSGLWVALLATGSLAVNAHAESGASSEVKTVERSTFAEGSPEVVGLSRWLQTKLSPTDRWYGDPTSLGQVTVTITKSRSSSLVTIQTEVPAPPAPGYPPNTGAPGDTYTISSCSVRSGLSQTWTFTYVSNGSGGGTWVVTEYHGYNVKNCSAG